MRIGIVAAGDVFGGAERQLISLAAALGPSPDCIVLQTLVGELSSSVRREGLNALDLSSKGGGMLQCAREIKKLTESEGIDVLHTHGYRAAFIGALSVAIGARVGLVNTIHGAPETAASPRNKFYEQVGRNCARLLSGQTVFVSSDLQRRFDPNRAWSRVIRNGVRVSDVRPSKPEQYARGRWSILSAGRLAKVKGLDLLVDMMALRSIPEMWDLHVLGIGPEEDGLRAYAVQIGVSKRVFFHGFRHDVERFVAHADCLAVPSHHEGIPYIILEAMGHGTPVVAASVGGIPEIIRDGVHGRLIDSRDPAKYASALLSYFRNPDEALEIALHARERVRTDFSEEAMAGAYREVYSASLTRVSSRRKPEIAR